jgi:O-antigen/teichoic acid export membrane protein
VATVSLTLGALFAAVVAGAAPEVARLVGSPGSADLLRVVVLTLPFTAYAGVQMGLVHRNLDFRRRLVPEAGSALIGAGVTIVCAARGLGEWSLVFGVVTTAVLAPVLGLLMGLGIRLRWSRDHAATFARWAAVVGPGAALGLVLLNVDYVIISRALGEAPTGLYSFAYRFAFLPYIMGAVVLGQVAFPIYTRLVRESGEGAMAAAVTRFVHVVAATTGGAYLTLALLADRVVVLDPRWEASVTTLQILCAYGFLLSLVVTGHEALRASGSPTPYLVAQVVHVVLLVIGASLLVHRGITGVAWAQVGAAAVATTLVGLLLASRGLLQRSVAVVLLRPLLAAGVVAAAFWLVGEAGLLPAAGSLPGGLVVAVLVVLAYAAVLLALDRALLKDLLAALRR